MLECSLVHGAVNEGCLFGDRSLRSAALASEQPCSPQQLLPIVETEKAKQPHPDNLTTHADDIYAKRCVRVSWGAWK